MTTLGDHARRELGLIGEEPESIEAYVKTIDTFVGHFDSGGAFYAAFPTLIELMQGKNLTPITDDPDEWYYHGEDVWGAPGGIWQNKRNSEAFSKDGGKTYDLLSERPGNGLMPPIHTSKPHNVQEPTA